MTRSAEEKMATAAALAAAEYLMTKRGCSAAFTSTLFAPNVAGVSRTTLNKKFSAMANAAKAAHMALQEQARQANERKAQSEQQQREQQQHQQAASQQATKAKRATRRSSLELDALNERAVELVLDHGCSYADVASVFKLSVSTIARRCQRITKTKKAKNVKAQGAALRLKRIARMKKATRILGEAQHSAPSA